MSSHGPSPGLASRLARIALLLTTALSPAFAAQAGEKSDQPTAPTDHPDVIVTANSLFRDAKPERDLDGRAIGAYGLSTIDELLAELQGELNGEEGDEPVLLVNGERIYDVDEIGAYPVEALRRLQVLPRGTATRVGGKPGQRVISLSLKRQMRSLALGAASRLATEGKWGSQRGEATLTHIRGATRANLSLRARGEDALRESDRDIIQPDPRLPFSRDGILLAYPDLTGEIDARLSSEGGRVITAVPLPVSGNPSFADLAAAASQTLASPDLGDFRTLRPDSRNYDLNGSFNTRLFPWLSATLATRLGRSESESQRGLASTLFLVGADNLFSPFDQPFAIAAYGRNGALLSRSTRNSGEANLTLNATVRKWRLSMNGRHSRSRELFRNERDAGGTQLVAPDQNPFLLDVADLVPTRSDRATTRNTGSSGQLTLSGSPLKLPAGEVVTTFVGRVAQSGFVSRNSIDGFDPRRVSRSEQTGRASVDVPLTSKRNAFLPKLGELTASMELARTHFSDAGSVQAQSYGLTWEPSRVLRLRAALDEAGTPVDVELLGAPVLITPGARVFDVLTGETAEVTQVTGGNLDLRPGSTRTWRLSGLLRLVPSRGLQINVEYSDNERRNLPAALSPTSALLVTAFPDRFVRDADDRLVSVDLRPVNFAFQDQQRLRYGVSLNTPVGASPSGKVTRAPGAVDAVVPDEAESIEPPPPARSFGPRTMLQINLNHSLVLRDEIVIREGAATVDLLSGGAFGIGGGRVRHQLDGTLGLSNGGLGARLGLNWRSGQHLETRIDGKSETIRFSPLFLLNLRTFLDVRRLAPKANWASGLRATLNVANLANKREKVRDESGATPLQFQPAYRDPIGRTVEVEVRKVF